MNFYFGFSFFGYFKGLKTFHNRKSQVFKTSRVDTLEPITSKEVTHGLTDSGLDTKEPIENTDKSSSQNEYNTQKISSSDIEKADYTSTKTSIIDNKGQTGISSSINDKEQITNVPSNKDITEQSTNSQIGENTEKIISHATNEIIDKTTKPSNIQKTSIIDNTEKTNTQTPIKENTDKAISTFSLSEQITNEPSINKETESTSSTLNQENMKHTTSANYQV